MLTDKKMRNLIAVFVTMVFLVSLVSCTSFKEHLAMKDAAAAYKNGKWEDAANNYMRALNMNRYRSENWKHLGFCYWNMIEPGSEQAKDKEATDKALEAFQNYLKLVKQDDQIQDYIINLYINQNRIKDGVEYYKGLLVENPQDSRILYTLSIMYGKLGDFDKSLEYSKKKADLNPTEASGYIFIGALCWERSYNKYNPLPVDVRERLVAEGMEMIDKALSIEPKSFEGHVYKNLLYRQMSDIAKLKAEEEKDRRKKTSLLDEAGLLVKKADAERDIAKEIRKQKTDKPDDAGTINETK